MKILWLLSIMNDEVEVKWASKVTHPFVEVHVSVHLLGEHALTFANLYCSEFAVEVSTSALLWVVCGAALSIGPPRVIPDGLGMLTI